MGLGVTPLASNFQMTRLSICSSISLSGLGTDGLVLIRQVSHWLSALGCASSVVCHHGFCCWNCFWFGVFLLMLMFCNCFQKVFRFAWSLNLCSMLADDVFSTSFFKQISHHTLTKNCKSSGAGFLLQIVHSQRGCCDLSCGWHWHCTSSCSCFDMLFIASEAHPLNAERSTCCSLCCSFVVSIALSLWCLLELLLELLMIIHLLHGVWSLISAFGDGVASEWKFCFTKLSSLFEMNRISQLGHVCLPLCSPVVNVRVALCLRHSLESF